MTNQMIIFQQSQELAENGAIAYTGRNVIMVIDGMPAQVKETEPIHTFAEWKKAGFIVKKGQKAVARFAIWNYTDKPSKATKAAREAAGKEDIEAADPHYYLKEACFFSQSQVEALSK